MNGRLLVFAVVLFVTLSCTSFSKAKNTNVNFELAKAALGRFKTQKDVADHLGKPSYKKAYSEKEAWNYDEAGDGYQRLTFTFDRNKSLESVTWMPMEGEPESKLEGVFAHFPNKRFVPIETREIAPPHVVDTETIYSDGKFISILHSDYKKRVEIVAWSFQAEEGTPSSGIRKSRKVEY